MKKIFMNLSAGTTLAVAVALASCNNAEEVKKQVDAQNATIQTLVDEKLNALTEQVNTECATKVDSLANAAFALYQEEAAKLAKKGGKKPAPKPKPTPKKEEPKKETGMKGLTDKSNEGGKGLKELTDKTAEEKKASGQGGLKGLKDKKKE
jgi:hypothetical protein